MKINYVLNTSLYEYLCPLITFLNGTFLGTQSIALETYVLKKIFKILEVYSTNNKNRSSVYSYMALYWAELLSVVPTLGRFLLFVGYGRKESV